jgi:hypothetical protein
MENIEGMFVRYLEKVKNLTEEYDLGNAVFLQFKHEMTDLIYEAAIHRNEFRWAMHFQKQYRS